MTFRIVVDIFYLQEYFTNIKFLTKVIAYLSLSQIRLSGILVLCTIIIDVEIFFLQLNLYFDLSSASPVLINLSNGNNK